MNSEISKAPLSPSCRSSRRFKALASVFALSLAVSASSCGRGQEKVPGLESFHAGVLQSRLYVSFVSTTLHWDQGLTLPIPGLEDASVGVSPDLATSGTVFQFSIGLASLLDSLTGGHALPDSGLPDGRPLPDIQDGKLPRWDAKVRDLNLSLYLSSDAFGLFVPLSFVEKGARLPFQVSVRIEDERGNTLGKAYAIPSNVNGSGSGLFILLPYLGAEPHSAGAL